MNVSEVNRFAGAKKLLQPFQEILLHKGQIQRDPMLSYFLSSLDVRFRDVSTAPAANPVRDNALQEIKRALAACQEETVFLSRDDAWTEAYRIERLFALVESPEALVVELERRVAEAADEKVASATRLATAADAAITLYADPKNQSVLLPGGETVLRALLLSTLEEIHWTIQRKFYSRPIRKSATTRIVVFGMTAFALFLMPYLWLYYAVWFKLPNPIEHWAWLPIYSAATAGLFGALFSRLLYLQTNWDALSIGGLKDAREFSSIFLRGCVGLIGAVLVFFFLRSGVISGGLFPNFSMIGLEEFDFPIDKDQHALKGALHLYYPSKDWALLVVWCFLAGFSERLVPSILQDSETTLGKSKK